MRSIGFKAFGSYSFFPGNVYSYFVTSAEDYHLMLISILAAEFKYNIIKAHNFFPHKALPARGTKAAVKIGKVGINVKLLFFCPIFI